jgi:hypothetical protein
MKISRSISLLIICLLLPSIVIAEEISLYDSKGEAVAYIDTEDQMTIYLWEGLPVAYYEDGIIWGFSGVHLGWLAHGVIIDHEGYVVGSIKGGVKMTYQPEPLKSLKSLKPLKSLKELVPLKPKEMNCWSAISLNLFLRCGR